MYQAYADCKKNKGATKGVIDFDAKKNKNLIALHNDLVVGIYHPSVSVCFIITKPSVREVFAADFRDRIVHHILVRAIEARFERRFIHHSYACRTGKGIHRALKDVRTSIHTITKHNTCGVFFMHLDVSGFFMSINKDILFKILQKQVKHPALRALAQKIIFHDPTTAFVYHGDPRLKKLVPPHKSLFSVPKGQGLPIGNLTSQFFANVYLNELDHYAKNTLHIKHYFRYADDILFLATTKEELLVWRKQIDSFLKEHLALSLNTQKTKIGLVTEGIDWLGYVIHPTHTLVRKRIVHAAKQKIRYFEHMLAARTEEPDNTLRIYMACSINSYFGFFSHGDTFKLRTHLYDTHFNLLKKYLVPKNPALISFTPMLREEKK